MPYSITRHAEHLVWVVMDGHLALHHAESYFCEMWQLLDGCSAPMDLLVDGRRIAGAAQGARKRTEQIAHHPNLGHLAFVVGEFHMLLFAPFVKLVSGIGLFGDEGEALAYLRSARGLPPVVGLDLPGLPPAVSAEPQSAEHHPQVARGQRSLGARQPASRPLPPMPTSRLKQTPLYQRGPAPRGGEQRAGAGDGESE
jgi:hypothetical protein